MALYVYGIMRSRDGARAVEKTDGKVDVRVVEHDAVAALVSPVANSGLQLRRENILAHSDILQTAFEHGPVLPLRFGTVVGDEETVQRELLAPSIGDLAARLEALDGKVEMQLKAIYAEEPLLRSILAQDPALAQSVQRTQGSSAAATHFERIRIGEAITGAVQARGEVDGKAFLDLLAPITVGYVISPPHHERAVANVSFLVDRAELARFDQAVQDLSEQRGGEIEFSLIGPMPPYSFADRDLTSPAPKTRSAWA